MGSVLGVSAIVVNYNGGLYLEECVKSLLTHLDAQNGIDEIIVVDNSSTDNSVESISAYPEVKVVRSLSNAGYGSGCNVGYEHAGGSILLFMNPDTVLVSSIGCVREIFEQDSGCAIVAPGVIEKGVLCSSLRPLPSILSDALGELGVRQWFYHKLQLDPKAGVAKKYDYFTGYAQGSALFVRRSAFEQVEKFDVSFFLYYEEVDLFKRLEYQGYSFVYDLRCLVKHSSGGSSFSLDWNKTAIRYNSKLQYFTKHTSKKWLALHRALMLTILFSKIILYPLGLHQRQPKIINAYIYGIRLYLKGCAPWIL